MEKKILLLLTILVVAFIFCGAASAATVNTNHTNTVKVNKVVATVDQFEPAIDGTRIVWTQGDASGHSAIYYKNLATGSTGKVLISKLTSLNQIFLVQKLCGNNMIL